MSVAGISLLNEGVQESNRASNSSERNSADGTIANGALLLAAGSICNIVAWVKFTLMTDDALEAVDLASVNASPYLYLARDGRAAPGLFTA